MTDQATTDIDVDMFLFTDMRERQKKNQPLPHANKDTSCVPQYIYYTKQTDFELLWCLLSKYHEQNSTKEHQATSVFDHHIL